MTAEDSRDSKALRVLSSSPEVTDSVTVPESGNLATTTLLK